jgi:hypothetical protein
MKECVTFICIVSCRQLVSRNTYRSNRQRALVIMLQLFGYLNWTVVKCTSRRNKLLCVYIWSRMDRSTTNTSRHATRAYVISVTRELGVQRGLHKITRI